MNNDEIYDESDLAWYGDYKEAKPAILKLINNYGLKPVVFR